MRTSECYYCVVINSFLRATWLSKSVPGGKVGTKAQSYIILLKIGVEYGGKGKKVGGGILCIEKRDFR